MVGKIQDIEAKDIAPKDLIIKEGEAVEVEDVVENGYETIIQFVDGAVRRPHYQATLQILLED